MNNITRITGNYRCKDEVSELIIRIKLKEILNENIVEDGEKIELEDLTIKWQEKRFGKWEKTFYDDENNCLSDLDKKYHEEVKKRSNNKILYSYVNEDDFCRLEEKVDNSKFVSELSQKMENLQLTTNFSPFINNDFEVMYIMGDFGEYVENTWIKQEYILTTIKYFPTRRLLTIYPDFTVFNPYKLTINGDITKTYEYTIENASHYVNGEENKEIFDKLNQFVLNSSLKNNFLIPRQEKLNYYLFLEIKTGENFEYDNVYVQYYIDLPESWCCFDQKQLNGSTQSCVGLEKKFYFGAVFEIILSVNLDVTKRIFDTPFIYFEVVSKDTFNRFRIEGISYLKLPILPGVYNKRLDCLRINPDKNELRRFFIGDFMSYDDITWFSIPKTHQDTVLNKQGTTTVNSGSLEININIIEQSRIFMDTEEKNRIGNRRERIILNKLNGGLKGVREVLKAFKEARKKMLEAREKLRI